MGGCILALFFIADIAALTLTVWRIISIQIAIIIGVIPVVICFLSWLGMRNAKPTEMVCPNCKSKNIRIELMNSGSVMAYDPKSNVGFSSNTTNKVGLCNDCGTSFPFAASNEIQQSKNSIIGLLVVFIIFLAVIIWFGKSSRDSYDKLVQQVTTSTYSSET